MLILLFAFALQGTERTPRPQSAPRGIAIDERLAADAKLRVGDIAVLTREPDASSGDTVRVAAVVRRRADPSEIARSEYRVRLHLDQLQSLLGYGDRVDRFAIATRSDSATTGALNAINASAFGFRAHRSADIAVETSETFRVVSRFHGAIGVITIVASAVFLLCVLLLRIDERRRDIAALRLAGISRSTVMRAVVLEAALIAMLGSGVGVAFGWLTAMGVNSYYQRVYRTPLEFALVTPDIVLLAVTLSLVLGIGAGALAAGRLVRTPPLDLLGR